MAVSLRLDKVHKCYWLQTDRMQSRPIIIYGMTLLTIRSDCANHCKVDVMVHERYL